MVRKYGFCNIQDAKNFRAIAKRRLWKELPASKFVIRRRGLDVEVELRWVSEEIEDTLLKVLSAEAWKRNVIVEA